jgi:thiamine-phosphate pyrophosphorylase
MSDSASRQGNARTRLARAAERLAAAAGSPLPPLILFTDDERLPDPVAAAKALPRGSLVIVRARDARQRRDLALALREVARARGLLLSIAGDAALARSVGADGVHLPQAQIGEAARLRHRFLVTASAHSLAAFRRAGPVDAMILSAVFPTASHPGRVALGVCRANLMAQLAPLPVYALGGISAENARRLRGFCGIAAIGALKG